MFPVPFLFGLLLGSLPLGAAEGLSRESARLHPGKLDFHFRQTVAGLDTEHTNLIWWSPVFKGGVGVIDNGVRRVRYGGGFLRWPVSSGWPGELIAGAEVVETEAGEDYEIQAEYRLSPGLGLGGGLVRRESAAPEVTFLKAAFRGSPGSWHAILETQFQELGEQWSPGGYAALYNPRYMVVAGHDGEQVRAAAGYLAPEGRPRYRPSLEVLYFDHSVGDLTGPEVIFINGTLNYGGGFLSHPARLGRAMGPTGLEFGNPISFLWGEGPWNRQLDVWELGGLGDLRIFRVRRPDGTTSTTYEALAFPLQLDGRPGPGDGLFIGVAYKDLSYRKNDPGILTGWTGQVDFLRFAVDFEYFLESGDVRINLGVIDRF
jgi:hypothetical protein